jgi:hypothetical protein
LKARLNLVSYWIFATLLLVAGCRWVPEYYGEGQIANTSSRRDGSPIPFAEYSITLASFPVSTNLTREFQLGNLGFFQKTSMHVCIRFVDDHTWWHFRHLTPGEKEPSYVKRFHMRDADKIQGRLSYQLLEDSGAELLHADTPLSECNWSGKQLRPYPRTRVEISVLNNSGAKIPKNSNLKLRFSYRGDPSLTNEAHLVLLCWPTRK